ncbi:hypothetical protein EMCRGX_G024337 [Ephydatia muelleri]
MLLSWNRGRTDPNYHDWSKYQAKSIKLGMNQFSPLVFQKAKASMDMVKGHELLNSLGIHLHWLPPEKSGENFCLDEGRCFSTDNTSYTLHFTESIWSLSRKLYNTFVGTGRDGSLQQLCSLPLLLRSQCLLTSDSSRGVFHLMLV